MPALAHESKACASCLPPPPSYTPPTHPTPTHPQSHQALKYKGEKYALFWPKRPEFVRLAARFGATIVPFSAVGAEDGVNQLLDGRDLAALPLLGPALRAQQESITKVLVGRRGERRGTGGRGDGRPPCVRGFRFRCGASHGSHLHAPPPTLPAQCPPSVPPARRAQARVGVSAAEEVGESFIWPVVSFNPPARFYFKFGAPVRTDPAAADDRAACDALYAGIKADVEGGIAYLLRKRGTDPYRDLLPRLVYEASRGGRKQAPTFEP
jgi:hypothetical protein